MTVIYLAAPRNSIAQCDVLQTGCPDIWQK